MIDIRSMASCDLPFCGRLSEQAGWNQTASDWRRFIEIQSDGCFVAEQGGQPVGTVTTCVFDQVGWIGMLLIEPSARRQGVGRALMNRSIQYLESQAVDAIRLDATPMGESLYMSLGFKNQYRLTRFTGSVRSPGDEHTSDFFQKPDWGRIATFDEGLTGYSRQKLFNRFGSEPNIHVLVVQDGREMLLATSVHVLAVWRCVLVLAWHAALRWGKGFYGKHLVSIIRRPSLSTCQTATGAQLS